MREVAAQHEDVAATCGEPSRVLVRKRRNAYPLEEVLARPHRQFEQWLAVELRREVVCAVDHQQELRHPDGAQLDDADAQRRMALENTIENQITDGERRRYPQ